jgi:pimeloyl-ACP methyl ester carboxylesterase
MSGKPTLVFVPGAWHTAGTWSKTTALLSAQGYKCICITLPSTLGDPSATFLDDLTAVRDAIVGETTQGIDVVVVAHSYGGLLGSSAIKGLTRGRAKPDSSPATTPTGHVIGLAMIATGYAKAGLCFIDATGGNPPPFWIRDESTGFAKLIVDTRELFYHDLPAEEGAAWVAKLTNQSLKPLFEGGEHVYSGWKEVPSWYLATMDDKAFPGEAQVMFAKMSNDDGGDITIREVMSSHSPMLSKPQETTEFILEAVKDFVKPSVV